MANPLASELAARIRRDGPVTYRDYVEAALYDERFGYYGAGRVRFGRRGDFTTSSGLDAFFGEALARWALGVWRDLGRPSDFAFVEVGPGTGRLAADMLAAIDRAPERPARLSFLLDERSGALRAVQERALEGRPEVSWVSLAACPPRSLDAAVIANEVVDALPFHRLRAGDGGLEELYVVAGPGDALGVEWGPPSAPRLAEAVCRASPRLLETRERFELEVRPDAAEWLRAVSRPVARGRLLVLDYGGAAETLYGPHRPHGTAREFHGHRSAPAGVYAPGERDITADVDFTSLAEAAARAGLRAAPLRPQRAFLLGLGLAERVAQLASGASGGREIERLLALKQLLVPGGVGDAVKALEMYKV